MDTMDLDDPSIDVENTQENYNALVGIIRTLQACKGPMDVYFIPPETYAKWNSWLGIYIRVMEYTMNDTAQFERDPPTFQAAIREAHRRALDIRVEGGVSPKTAAAFCSLCQSILTVSQTTESLMHEDDERVDDILSDILAGLKVAGSASLTQS